MSDGLTGRVPAWYGVVQAAKWLGISPMDVLNMPLLWFGRVQAAMEVEAEVRKEAERRARD